MMSLNDVLHFFSPERKSNCENSAFMQPQSLLTQEFQWQIFVLAHIHEGEACEQLHGHEQSIIQR